ncbi:uncharacterized protein METZ01_LOCUS355122, partial [marine metagenome]
MLIQNFNYKSDLPKGGSVLLLTQDQIHQIYNIQDIQNTISIN